MKKITAREKNIIELSKAGNRKPVMPSPKIMIDRKKQANKTACRGKEY